MGSTKYEEIAFDFGVEGLDEYYPRILVPGTLIAIAGHPGSGKTTLAAQICYSNAVKGKKCLIVSTQESEEKFLKFMVRFGFNFEPLIVSDRFRFARLPLISSEEALDGFLEALNSLILEFRPQIIVIDSITPIAKVIANDARRRALIQNYFYNVAFDVKGLIILIAEIPLGKTVIENSGDIEFIADGIIILKHEPEYGLLSRKIEIRKLRGAPLEAAEFPFAIKAPGGIVILAPPKLETLSASWKSRKPFKLECKILEEVLGELHSGDIVLLAGPPYRMPLDSILKWISEVGLKNNAKILMITYKSLEDEVREALWKISEKLGRPDLPGRFNVVALNPAEISPEAIFSVEIGLLSSESPDIAVFHGVETLNYIYKRYAGVLEKYLKIESLMIKKLNALTFRIASIIDLEDVELEMALADAGILVGDPVTGLLGNNIIIYKTGERARRYVGAPADLEPCF
ncbi:MAG: ATPase domain-containing protein [Thermoprotei archaeon]|nr:ATPase domain-containing protein [Thermoprotei archaeon]